MLAWERYHNDTAYCWLPRPDAGGGGGAAFNCGIELEDGSGLIELEDGGFIELDDCGGAAFNCGIELEDSSGLIELEDGGFIELEECY